MLGVWEVKIFRVKKYSVIWVWIGILSILEFWLVSVLKLKVKLFLFIIWESDCIE